MSAPKHTAGLDTSGEVQTVAGSETALNFYSWDRLSPFTQGYIEALFADLPEPTEGDRLCEAVTTTARRTAFSFGNAVVGGRCTRKATHFGRSKYWCAQHAKEPASVLRKASGRLREGVYPLRSGMTAPGFSDLAPETLARIIADCESGGGGLRDDADGGRDFWTLRQAGASRAFPPLTVQLGDDGKVRFAKATGADQ